MIVYRNEKESVIFTRNPSGPIVPRNLRKPAALIGAAIALGGGAYGIVAATASNGSGTATPPASPASPRQGAPGPRGSNARSGPAAGGASGTVDSLSTSSFTLTTSAGQKVTVNEVSSTKYQKGTSSISASAVKKGESVLVLGTTNGTTITATQVTVQPAGRRIGASSAAAVVPFQRARRHVKASRPDPGGLHRGSGTIVSGTTANKATEAALAAYPGGIVDRVVKLSDGEYEVHNIGVNWPHHVFVNESFKVIGAD